MTINYRRLSFAEREEISKGIFAKESFSKIAKRLNRNVSTISNEVHIQVKRKRWCYSAIRGQELADEKRKIQGRKRKLSENKQLLNYIQTKLRQEWSPEEIAERLKLDYPNDMTMRISHETVYQYLYCLPRGELKKELMKGLRQERKLRLDRKAIHSRRPTIKDIISISERPEEVADRTVPGHWEGDLIVGKLHRSAIGTLVERTTRLTLLVPLKNKDAISVSQAFALAFKRIPKQFTKTLTYDRGAEMAEHKQFTKETKIKVFFADPHSPWQRGTNENTNGLIRQYFPKGTDFGTVSLADIKKAENRLNSRPRKALGFYTPSERFYELTTGQSLR
ncbi:MAG TPA: IS30 family transposase [bacterium]|jgi:IS30 family transposase|nr:IS30 family transposase [bacterium]